METRVRASIQAQFIGMRERERGHGRRYCSILASNQRGWRITPRRIINAHINIPWRYQLSDAGAPDIVASSVCLSLSLARYTHTPLYALSLSIYIYTPAFGPLCFSLAYMYAREFCRWKEMADYRERARERDGKLERNSREKEKKERRRGRKKLPSASSHFVYLCFVILAPLFFVYTRAAGLFYFFSLVLSLWIGGVRVSAWGGI